MRQPLHVAKKGKKITLFQLVMAGFSSMIGSGWLFGSWKAAKIAGPYAILAWPVGFIIMLLLALSYAELGASYPKSGGMARFAELTHGSLTGFIAGWTNWVSIVSVIPIEAVSTIRYLSSQKNQWSAWLYNPQTHALSGGGLLCAAALIFVYFLINYWSMKLFLRCMVLISVVKIVVPLLTLLSLYFYAFHAQVMKLAFAHSVAHPFNAVVMAVASSGIIFCFHGFQTPINLSGEASNPSRNVPLAVFISMLTAFLLCLLLQVVFLGSLSPAEVLAGWQNLDMTSPYVQLALSVQLNWLVMVLYLDAVVSPSGTAITYTATSSRVLGGLQKNGYLPYFIGYRHPLYQISRPAMWVNLVICMGMLFFFKTWSHLVAVISVCVILSYITGPICAIVLRKYVPIEWRPLCIPGLPLIAPCSFFFMSCVLYWASWPLTAEVIFVILIGLPICFYYLLRYNVPNLAKSIRAGVWLVCYLLSMILLSYLGRRAFGGIGVISHGWDYVLIVLICAFYYYWGLRSGWLTRRMSVFRKRTEMRYRSRQ